MLELAELAKPVEMPRLRCTTQRELSMAVPRRDSSGDEATAAAVERAAAHVHAADNFFA